jgi:hypothetical protein
MSTTLKDEINRLNFTQDERTRLCKYFIGNIVRQEDAMYFLPSTDDERLKYFKSLISTPGMFSNSFYRIL